MTLPRLCATAPLSGLGAPPDYIPEVHGTGIVHIGAGAFFRAHIAAYTDMALATSGGNWRICAVSLRNPDLARALGEQDGRYTLMTRSPTGTTARVIASVASAVAVDPATTLAAMANPDTRIVSLTVTERGYGIDRRTGGADWSHPAVATDLINPAHPRGVLGLLATALDARRKAGLAPFTVLCCDNLPENGKLLRGALVDFVRCCNRDLADWIEAQVAFPCTVVDRITPAATPETLVEAARQTGCTDLAAIETEAFHQWIIEDHFPTGRPDWGAMGAVFVSDVARYEQMKLTMLNGTHSMLAYAGFIAGHRYVRDVMADANLAVLVRRHLHAASALLPPLPEIDLKHYAEDLIKRFENTEIAHETRQIATDGTEKLPQRLLAPALVCLERGGDLRPFAFAVAGWMRYTLGVDEANSPYPLHDPMEPEIRTALPAHPIDARSIVLALQCIYGLFPPRLAESAVWVGEVTDALDIILTEGMRQAIRLEVAK